MRHLRLLLPLLLATLSAPTALSQCSEPSALDQSPGSEPLRVEKSGSRDLRVSWESVLSDGYRLHRGRLDRLFANEAYDHRVLLESTETEEVIDEPSGSWYFLVNATCRASDSGVGRDSTDRERPFGGLISLRIGLQGGMGVSGTQMTLLHPAAESFTDDDGVEFLGPYAPAAPGTSFGAVNTLLEGQVIVAVTLLPGGPDSSFDPPPDMPIDVIGVLFGYHGSPPAAGDFALDNCSQTDEFGNPLPAVTCSISGFDVLF